MKAFVLWQLLGLAVWLVTRMCGFDPHYIVMTQLFAGMGWLHGYLFGSEAE